MRRNNTQNIGEVIKELLKELRIDDKLKEVGIINSWEEVLGEKISRSTSKLFVKNKVLFVYLKSSVVRNELMMLKSGIIKALNEKAGSNVIEDIVFR
jgi:predicted nucleic acid-binding Zn ribbon protein